MSDSQTYNNVTAAILACVETTSNKEHGTVYAPPSPATAGTATTHTVVGTVALSFSLDTTNNSLTYSILSKPGIVSDSEIWNGGEGTLKSCGWSG